MDLKDWEPNKMKVLLIGESGSGKTSNSISITSLPMCKRVWVASFDGGVASMKGTLKRLGITDAKVEVDVFIETNRKLPNAYNNFLTKLGEKEVSKDVDVIILDGITHLSKYCFDAKVAMNQLTDKKYGNEVFHLYRLLMDSMRDVITRAIMCSKFVVGTCLPQWEKDENSGDMYVFPDVEGKSTRQALPSWFDEVYYCQTSQDGKTGKVNYELWTAPKGKFMAKTRWGGDIISPVEGRHLGEVVGSIVEAYK